MAQDDTADSEVRQPNVPMCPSGVQCSLERYRGDRLANAFQVSAEADVDVDGQPSPATLVVSSPVEK